MQNAKLKMQNDEKTGLSHVVDSFFSSFCILHFALFGLMLCILHFFNRPGLPLAGQPPCG